MKYSKNSIYLVFIISIIAIVLCFLYETYNIIESLNEYNAPDIQLLVSRYNEDLEWLKDEPFNKFPVVCYNKGPNSDFYKPENTVIIKKENVGVCVDTYLDYIINNYDNLPDIVVFLPGSCMDNNKEYNKKNMTVKTMELVSKTNNSVFIVVKKYENNNSDEFLNEFYNFSIEEHPLSNLDNAALNNDTKLQPCKIRPFGKWYETLFPGINIFALTYRGIFAVSRKHIQSRSK